VQRRPLALDRVGATLSYRAVGRGGDLRDARTQQLTLAGNDLKPYARAQVPTLNPRETAHVQVSVDSSFPDGPRHHRGVHHAR
jgi:hypothetical protein